MTPHQQGRAAERAGRDIYSNPFPIATVRWFEWRRGWVASVTEAVRGRTSRKAA